MSNLNSNTLWADISQDLADLESGNIDQTSTDVLNQILGPSYDYTANIQPPSAKGVGSSGTVGQVITNADAIGGYVSNLTLGPLTGNQFFMNTGGMCTVSSAGDPNNGQTVPRSTYVNNRLEGSDVLDDFPSLSNALGGDLNTFDGLIPGMMGDLVALNPTTVFNALVLPGTPTCRAYTCPVTDTLGNAVPDQSYYLTPGLETNINRCTPATTAPVTSPGAETFAPYFGDTRNFEPMAKRPLGPTTTDKVLFAGAVLLTLGLITTYAKNR